MNPTSRNTRRWTDDSLRAAVASSVTWRQVAQALGLSNGTATRLKRYALSLNLDTAHFKETRRWSERDLRDAVADTSSWPEVMRRLRIDDTSEARVRIKGHAVRLGIDVSALDERKAPSSVATFVSATPNRSRLGTAAEVIAVAWFTLRGIPVAVPTEPTDYDLLVSGDDGVKKVQVKSSTYKRHKQTWKVGIGRRPYVLDKTANKAPYDPDAIDFYFVVVGDGGLYFIPSHVVAGMTAINIGAYEEYRVGDASSLFTSAA